MSMVRGRSQEDPMPEGQWPRVPGCNGTGTAKESYPSPRSRAAAGRSYPTFEVGVAAERSNPTSKELWLQGCRRA